MALLVEQFADILEERYGKGIYRKIKVVPGNGVYKKKPFGEKSNMPRADIIKNRIGVADWDNFSFAIKYSEDLYCVDFDTKVFKNTEFFDTLRNMGAYHTETQKGWHFYINIVGLPRFQNEINLAHPDFFDSPQDVDLLYQKRNVWEPRDREVKGCSFVSVNWEDIQKYFNPAKMNFVGAEAPAVPAPAVPAPVPAALAQVVVGEEVTVETCDEETMKGLLNRLAPERVDDSSDWLNIAMAIYTNFYELGDLVTGWCLFDEWSKTGTRYHKQGNKTRWDSFANRPDNPLTYKSIRRLADEDTTENVYESIYKGRGAHALVEYINEDYIYNKASSNIIYLDNGRHYLKKMPDIANDLAMYNFVITDPKGKAREIRPADVWKCSTKRRCVRAIDFDPSGKKQNIYNLWKGYFITASNSESAQVSVCQPLLNHLKSVWCAGQASHYEYVLNWFAWVLQHPETKIGVMLCIRSRQGGGKGTILEVFSHIMDGDRDTNYYSQCSNLESIIGNFTTGIEGKCLLNFDEAFWGGDKKKEGMIKNLITEPTQEIRVKNHSPYNVKNTTAFILTTNAERFSGVTKDDRRHFCLECDDSHLDTKSKSELSAYFSAVTGRKYNEPTNVEMCRSFAKVLYARDLSQFNPQEFPKTELAFNQIQQGWSSVVKWWFSVLDSGVLYHSDLEEWNCRLDNQGEVGDWGISMTCDNPGTVIDGKQLLFKNFVYYAYKTTNLGGYNSMGKDDSNQFWSITARMFRNKEIQSCRWEDEEHIQHRMVCFADIDTLREAFKKDQKVGDMKIYDYEIDE